MGSVGDDPSVSVDNEHEFRNGDIVLAYSDGMSDNLYTSNFDACILEQLENGVLKSASEAADCLAHKAYFLGKNK